MKGKFLAFGVSLLAMATIGVVQLQTKAVDNSRDCDQYAVIRCGALNGDELRAEFESNNTSGSNGYTTEQGDIKKIFNSMGINKADLEGGFKQGIVYKNGNVEVDGKVVATNAQVAARGLGGTQIPGTNAQKVPASAMGDAQTAMVKMDQDGKFLFAVMKPCGNPVTAEPKKTPEPQPEPKAECVSLKLIEQEPTKYALTATAKVSGGAKIESYTFELFRGTDRIMNNTYASTNESQSVVYVVTDPGEYKATVSVKTSEGAKTSNTCQVTFSRKATPPPPPQTPAVDITKFVNNDQKYARVNTNVEFSYRIQVKNTGTVDLENVTVTDTPNAGITLIERVTPPIDGAKFANNTFTITGMKLLKGEVRTFTLYAKVPVALAGKLPNTVCVDAPAVPGTPDKCDTAEVEVPPTPVPGKIEVCLKNEDRYVQINENEFNDQIHSRNPDDCKKVETPTELPETGPVETFASIIGAMSLVGASAYYVVSRRSA